MHCFQKKLQQLADEECRYSTEEVDNIWHIFDPPSLLRKMRRMFFDSHFVYLFENKMCIAEFEEVMCALLRNARSNEDFLKRESNKTEYAAKLFSSTLSKLICRSPCTGEFLSYFLYLVRKFNF